jgi:hypothetical protein
MLSASLLVLILLALILLELILLAEILASVETVIERTAAIPMRPPNVSIKRSEFGRLTGTAERSTRHNCSGPRARAAIDQIAQRLFAACC